MRPADQGKAYGRTIVSVFYTGLCRKSRIIYPCVWIAPRRKYLIFEISIRWKATPKWKSCSAFKVTEPAAAKTGDASETAYSVGEAVKIQWKGSWYDGSIIAVNNKKKLYKVHFDGYNNSWDECVKDKRLQKKWSLTIQQNKQPQKRRGYDFS